MRMFTIPNQSSVAMAYKEFDEAGRMRPSSYYDRIVDVMEELVRFTVLLRPHATNLSIATPNPGSRRAGRCSHRPVQHRDSAPRCHNRRF